MTRRPVTATARLEVDADEARYIRVIPRDPWAPMVTARWRPRWSWARTWRHRERVRFGAWEARPSGRASASGQWAVMSDEGRARLLDACREIARCSGWGPEPPENAVKALAMRLLWLGAWAVER